MPCTHSVRIRIPPVARCSLCQWLANPGGIGGLSTACVSAPEPTAVSTRPFRPNVKPLAALAEFEALPRRPQETSDAAARNGARSAVDAGGMSGSGPSDADSMGELRIRVSHAQGIDATGAFVKIRIANQDQVSRVAKAVSASEHRWDEDLQFRGNKSVLTAAPMVISGWAIAADSSEQIGESRIDLGALLATMHGVLCGVPMIGAQVTCCPDFAK